MNSSPIGAHNFIWSSIEVVITRRTRNPLALRGPWVRIPPAPPEAKHPARVLFYLYEKGLPSKEGSLQRSPTPKTEKPIRGVSGKPWKGPQNYLCPLRETPRCGKGCARGIISLALTLVLSGPTFLDLCIPGIRTSGRRTSCSPLPYCFSVFCFFVLHFLLSIIGRL